jgi:hypothetical protein
VQVRLFYVATGQTVKECLALSVVSRLVQAHPASFAGVSWIDSNRLAALGGCLVLKLTPELAPALIQNGFVKSSLCFDIAAGLGGRAFGTNTHSSYIQIFSGNNRMDAQTLIG